MQAGDAGAAPALSVQTWWKAFRFHFVPPSYLPAVLGAVVAWAVAGALHLGYFVLTVLGVTLNHIALNMTDDYFDYRHSVDAARDREANPFSGGSGTLTSGAIRPGQMRTVFALLYAATAAIGVYLTVARGWPVLAFGLFGLASAYFYTAPPVRYGYLGLGEVSQLVNFSFTIGLGSYFVQAQALSWEALIAVLPLGFMMFSMITINEIPDAEDDRRGGKGTLVVRLGKEAGVWLYGAGMLMAYLVILAGPPLGLTSFLTYPALLTLPWFLKAFVVLRRHYREPEAMAPANLLTIRVHNLCGILLICGYAVQGGLNGGNPVQMVAPLLILAALWLPVALRIFRRPQPRGVPG
jgi:1,4-dihydroxy-2-naphthoate octaprenyltransferase